MAKPKQEDNSARGNAARESIRQQQQATRRRRRGKEVEQADWASVDAVLLHQLVCNVTGCDCAIQFGYTSDGGAYVIRIVGDGEPFNEFIRPTEDVELAVRSFIEDYAK